MTCCELLCLVLGRCEVVLVEGTYGNCRLLSKCKRLGDMTQVQCTDMEDVPRVPRVRGIGPGKGREGRPSQVQGLVASEEGTTQKEWSELR